MDVAVSANRLVDQLPSDHRFTLGAQIRKSALSIPSNIAEGHTHRGRRIYLRHVRIAIGSVGELDTQIEVAIRLRLTTAEGSATLLASLISTRRQLHGLEKALARKLAGVTLMFAGVVVACFTLLRLSF